MSIQQNPHRTAGTAAAHELAATLERLGLDPPASEVVCVARLESRRLRIVVSITEIKEGEEKLHLTPLGRQILGIDQPSTSPPATQPVSQGGESGEAKTPSRPPSPSPPVAGPPVIACILEAAPPFNSPPITMRKLAGLAGYSYCRYFRDKVNSLVESGELVQNKTGFRRRPL